MGIRHLSAVQCQGDSECGGTPGTTCVADYCQPSSCTTTGQCVQGHVCSKDENSRRCVCMFARS